MKGRKIMAKKETMNTVNYYSMTPDEIVEMFPIISIKSCNTFNEITL